MQICQLNAVEAEKVEHSSYVPDCHLHNHLSKTDARELVAAGKARFVGVRALTVIGASLTEHWYRKAVLTDDGRYLGRTNSGMVRTCQLVRFRPPEIRHKTKGIEAHGARNRMASARKINWQPGPGNVQIATSETTA
jgi:hypothetical protein